MAEPSDVPDWQVQQTAEQIYTNMPNLSRATVLAILREQYGWILSEERFNMIVPNRANHLSETTATASVADHDELMQRKPQEPAQRVAYEEQSFDDWVRATINTLEESPVPHPTALRDHIVGNLDILLDGCDIDKTVIRRPSYFIVNPDFAPIVDIPQMLFYAIWKNWLGPMSNRPMALARQIESEVALFPELFPDGKGEWTPEVDKNDYILTRLNYLPFRRNKVWLEWAISRTDDKEIVASINFASYALHRQTLLHVGGGVVLQGAGGIHGLGRLNDEA
ncbi:hypothetical protein F5Y16DRAFT_394845 [Xylariaceae sp. FL0255]|nr:hypothetical protein F5Y16DRAFT_394845 [Xylariaceae sp. FL0255]